MPQVARLPEGNNGRVKSELIFIRFREVFLNESLLLRVSPDSTDTV